MTEKVISIYDADDAESYGEAVAELAAAYTGWRASDSDGEE